MTANRVVGSWDEVPYDSAAYALNLDSDSYRLRDHSAGSEKLQRRLAEPANPCCAGRLRVRNLQEPRHLQQHLFLHSYEEGSIISSLRG